MLKSRTVTALTIFTVGSLLAGCAWFGNRPQPAWVEGRSADYPADQYLLGIGQADSRPSAEERAYGAVSRIFKARVEAESKDWESFLVLEARGRASTERRVTLDQVTRVSTDKALESVRILDAWMNPASRQHHVLAGMHRAQAGTALAERMAELDRTIEADLAESRQSADALVTIRSLRRAIKNLVLREAYNADLRVIRASGQGTPSRHRVPELTGALEQFMAAHLLVGVEVLGDQVEAVRRAVIEGLVREGLPVTARPAGAEEPAAGRDGSKPLELLVKGTVRLSDVDVPDPRFRYVRWCSDFVILEPGTQHVVGAVSRGGREGHLTQGEATAKAIRVMQQEVSSELAGTLAGYVYGDQDQPANLPPAACPQDTRGDETQAVQKPPQ
jgi:LPP20 lipoprotein